MNTKGRKPLFFKRGLQPNLKRIISMFELKIVVVQKAELYAKDEVVAIAPKLKRVIQNSSGKKLWGKNHPKKHNS